jgi:hypothetical protein
MHLVSAHIFKYLDNFVSDSDDLFNKVFNEIRNTGKFRNKKLLIYVDKVLNHSLINKNNDINCIHLHFEKELCFDIKLLIVEFIAIKLFFIGLDSDIQNEINDEIGRQIRLLESKTRKLSSCPEGASGKKGGNRIYKNWIKEKKETAERLMFFKKIPLNNCYKPLAILNAQENYYNKLLESFKTRPFVVDVNKLRVTIGYVILNNLNINELKTIKIDNDYILKNIKNLVLFDCESSVKKFIDYHYEFLSNLNRNHNTNFQNFFIFTFGKNSPNINNLRKRVELIKTRFKIPQNNAYSLLSKEIAHLTNQESGRKPSVVFYGEQSSTFWDVFNIETTIRDLYELRSIKMLNIYSLAFNEEIKNHILEDIFSQDKPSLLLTDITKQMILESPSEDIDTIRESLSNVIDLIIRSNWESEVKTSIYEDSTLLVPEEVLKDKELKNKIVRALQLSNQNKLTSWSSIDLERDTAILILAYKDQGRYPYYFYPNIIESLFTSSHSVNAIFLKTFFGLKYEWAVYNLNKEIHRLLDHPLRKEYFHWDTLGKEIKLLKPLKQDRTNWDLESDYTNAESRTVVKVTFKGIKRVHTFLPSDLFITKLNNNVELKVERIIDLVDIDLIEEILEAQSLDIIQNEINIYEKFIDLQQQEEELKVIRDQFRIKDTEAGRLWKILLKGLAVEKGEDTLYEQIKEYLKNKNLKVVSFYHFKQCWINPESVSITPLNNKIFIELCNYLGIPKSYFIIMQRIRNASKQATRQSTRQMSNLLKDLFNDGSFDDISRARNIIEKKLESYRKNHPLEEIGIDDNYLLENLVSLVELIKPEIKLVQIEKIETFTQ